MKRTINLEARGSEILRKKKVAIISSLFTGTVQDTPVKTGHLRANWKVSKDSPNTTVSATTADPTNEIQRTVESLVTPGNESIYLSNGVDYARHIEYDGGSPQKAPHGMVRINILKAIHAQRK